MNDLRSGWFSCYTALILLSSALQIDDTTLPLFDTTHVERAIDYLSAPSEEKLLRVADSAAASHLLKHSAITGYYPSDATSLDISRDLLGELVEPSSISTVERLLSEIRAAPEQQRACLAEAMKYLPEGFRFAEPLFVTWGYDIGVSMNGSASLNLAHPRFAANPEEIWFYCTHEMHHAGLTTFHPFPSRIADLTTAAELLGFIRYATMLEGMGVHAARDAREKADALESDPDYVALSDSARMAEYEIAYWRIYKHFETAGARPLTEEDWTLLELLSDGDRLWYRVGALMAATIEMDIGSTAFRELPRQGPDAFFEKYRQSRSLTN